MEGNLVVYGASPGQIRIYYIFVSLAFIYLMYRYRNKLFLLFLILLFSNGLFAFLGKNIHDIYKITVTLLALYWLVRTKSSVHIKSSSFVLISFLLFSISFIYSALTNGDYFTIIFSQYSRYFILIVLFLLFKKFNNETKFRIGIEDVIYQVLFIQIVLSIIKYIIMGPRESLVGSVASQGGAIATVLPLLGFMFLWIKKSGVLVRKDWWFMAGLLFIGFVSGKRAIWFIMPLLITLFIFYIPKRKIPIRIISLYITAIPLIFYLGLRLNPSLNPEYKIWGSFDPGYAMKYAQEYSFGKDSKDDKPSGRGSATLFLLNKILQKDLSKEDLFGNGLRFMFATNYEEFAELGLDIQHKGAATGVFQSMISNGFIGIVTFILFAAALIMHTHNKRLRIILFIFFFWEYFFYTGIVFREYALAVLFVYAIVFSGIQFLQNSIPLQTSRVINEHY